MDICNIENYLSFVGPLWMVGSEVCGETQLGFKF